MNVKWNLWYIKNSSSDKTLQWMEIQIETK